MNEEFKIKMQQEMLKQIDMVQEKGSEYYNSMIAIITEALKIKESAISGICTGSESFDLIHPFIISANEAILKSAEGLAITKEEIALFCEDARKNINNNSMSVSEMMMIKISLPLITMAITSNQSKDQVFELLSRLKLSNKL